MDLEIDTKGRSLACTIIIQEFPELSELLVDSLNNRTIWVSCLKQKLHGKQVREIRRHKHQTLRVNTASSVYISTFLEKRFSHFLQKEVYVWCTLLCSTCFEGCNPPLQITSYFLLLENEFGYKCMKN